VYAKMAKKPSLEREKKKLCICCLILNKLKYFSIFYARFFFSSFIEEAKKAQKPRTKNSHLQFYFKNLLAKIEAILFSLKTLFFTFLFCSFHRENLNS